MEHTDLTSCGKGRDVVRYGGTKTGKNLGPDCKGYYTPIELRYYSEEATDIFLKHLNDTIKPLFWKDNSNVCVGAKLELW